MKIIEEPYGRDLHRELAKVFGDVAHPAVAPRERSERFRQIALPRS